MHQSQEKLLSTRADEEPCWHYESRKYIPRDWRTMVPKKMFFNTWRPREGAVGASQGVKASEVKVLPQPVTGTFLSDRIEGMGAATSAAIVKALIDAQMLDSAGFLLEDPRCYIHPLTLAASTMNPAQ